VLDSLMRLFRGAADAGPASLASGNGEPVAAVAALLVEAAVLDGIFTTEERARILDLLRRRFTITAADAARAVDEAERAVAESSDMHRFTKSARDGLDEAGRIGLIEMLWEVVYADGTLHDYEAQLMRRLAGLLHVDDRDSGLARKRVLDRLAAAPASDSAGPWGAA
jgi:uncharacterized tellurite resistance protein B-like protein